MKLNYWYQGFCVTMEGTPQELLEKLIKLLNEEWKGYWELIE